MSTSNEAHSTIRCLWIATIVGTLVFTGHFKNETLGMASLLVLAVPSLADTVRNIIGRTK